MFCLIVRWILPVLALIIIIRCILPFLSDRKKNTPWGYLIMQTGARLPLLHWENSIGRSKLSDIFIELPFISRSHAVLTYSDNEWSIIDLKSKGGVSVNNKKVTDRAVVNDGDKISLAGLEMTLRLESARNVDQTHGKVMERVMLLGKQLNFFLTLVLIIVFQLLGSLQLCIAKSGDIDPLIFFPFLILVVAECLHCAFNMHWGYKCFEHEMLAYFLCGISLFVAASSSQMTLFKQLVAILIGAALFIILFRIMRDLTRARKLKYTLVVIALVLMAVNLAFGQIRNGAKNWIDFGFITFQPLEIVKISFVIAGSATLDRLLTTRNLSAFILFSGAVIGTLAITKDFGMALIFFCTFLVIAFMRSGDLRTIALISAGALLGGIAVISFIPYVSSRFSSWGHVWEKANSSGFQQTRTMVYSASGGLLGTGGGKGYLIKIAAAKTDLVFGVLCEEWGLIIALLSVVVILTFALFAILSVRRCRSSFYAIASCGAATIFLVQTALNVFGSVDLLPLTGVTFPFISNGGTSMVACWCLLSFIKSADERCAPDRVTVNPVKKAEVLQKTEDEDTKVFDKNGKYGETEDEDLI